MRLYNQPTLVLLLPLLLQSPLSFPVPTIFGRRFGFGDIGGGPGSPFSNNKCEQVNAADVSGLTARPPRWSCGLVVDGSNNCAAGGERVQQDAWGLKLQRVLPWQDA